MNKNALIETVSNDTGYTKEQTGEIVDALLKEIVKQLKKGEMVKLFGFGNFLVRNYKERQCYNPVTGEMITLKPSVQPAFVAGSKLRKELNSK